MFQWNEETLGGRVFIQNFRRCRRRLRGVRMDWLAEPNAWIAFATLAALEIVLGIDNIIFISILASKLGAAKQGLARVVGLAAAMLMRIGLLFSLSWIVQLTAPLFTIPGFTLLGNEVEEHGVSGRDLILICGGLFLLFKATYEIHHKLEGETGEASARVAPTFASVIVQIMLLDVVFSLDSVITAVGMVDDLSIMISAVVTSVFVMMLFAGPVSRFVERHPTVKMLALSFLLLIGFTLVVEGWHVHIPKGYIYFAMGFSVLVESLNLRAAAKTKPVKLHEPYVADSATAPNL
jgi:predicted tellurium resistance membrane protein TerC